MSFFAKMSGISVDLSGSSIADKIDTWVQIQDKKVYVEYVEQLYVASLHEPYIIFSGIVQKSFQLCVGIAPAWGSTEASLAFIDSVLGEETGFQKTAFKGCFAAVEGEFLLGKATKVVAHRKVGNTEHYFIPSFMPNPYPTIVFGTDRETNMPLILEKFQSKIRIFFPIGEKFY